MTTTKIVLSKDIGRGLAVGAVEGIKKLNVYISNDTENIIDFGTDNGIFVHRVTDEDINTALGYVAGTVHEVRGAGEVSGLTLTGTVTDDGELTLGGTLEVLPENFDSQAAATVLAAPAGANGKPTFRAIAVSDIPTLNQDTTGQAGNVEHKLLFGIGLTGQAGGFTADDYDGSLEVRVDLDTGYGDSLNPYTAKAAHYILAAPADNNGLPTFRPLQASDVPTLNQNTTGSAATLTTPRKINGVNFDGGSDITISAVDTVTPRIAVSQMGVANGVATLDGSGIIYSSQLPSYVDDVLEFNNVASFPTTGETGKIYVAKNAGTAADPSRQYRWSGTQYIEIEPSPGSTDAVPEGGTNKYFTNQRALDAVASFVQTTATNTVNSAASLLKDIVGFPNRTSSTLAFNDATRTLTLTPVGTLKVYKWGVEYTIASALNLVISNTSGGRYIKYNPVSGLLEEISGNPVFSDDILVSYIYWDAVAGWASVFADERHSTARDTQWHMSQHLDIGAVWRSGGTLSYTLNNPSAVNLAVSGPVVIADEDLVHTIVDGSGTGNYEQVLSAAAQLPCLYLKGTTYTEVAFNTIPWVRNGNGAVYNPVTGGIGALADVPNTEYFAYWIVATNDIRSPIKTIMGRNHYNSANLAAAELFDSYGLPLPEFVPLYKVVLHKQSGNTQNAALVQIVEVHLLTGRQVSLSSSFSGTSHNSLTDRSLADQHPMSAITGLVTAFSNLSNVDNTHDADKVVASAGKWTTPRTVTLTGDAGGSFTLDGSSNVSGSLTLAASGVLADSGYTKVTVNNKGVVTFAGYINDSDVINALGYTPYNNWSFSGLANGQVMVYNGTTGLWENKNKSVLGIIDPTGIAAAMGAAL